MEEQHSESQGNPLAANPKTEKSINILLAIFKARSLEEAFQNATDYFQKLTDSYSNCSQKEKRNIGRQALTYVKALVLWPVATREIRDLYNQGLQIAINYGDEEAKILLARHQEVCELLDGDFEQAYDDAFSENDPIKIQQIYEKYPDQLNQVLLKDPFLSQEIEEIYFQLGNVYQAKAHGKGYGPEREKAKQCYYLAARLASAHAIKRLQEYVQLSLIEKDDIEFQYHQVFINPEPTFKQHLQPFIYYHHPKFGNDLEKDIRNVCKLNPNKFCEMLAADHLLLRKQRETCEQYLIKYHFDELSHENQRSLRRVVVEIDIFEEKSRAHLEDIEMDELPLEKGNEKKVKSYVDRHYPDKTLSPQKSVFAIKASFFESSSDEENNTTGVTLSSEKDIQNSNNSTAPG